MSVVGVIDSEAVAAMAALEAAAEQLGHIIGSWDRGDKVIWLTSCTRCQRLGWIMRPGFGAWRPGGPLVEEACESG